MTTPERERRLTGTTTLMIAIGTLLAGLGTVLALFIARDPAPPSTDGSPTPKAAAASPTWTSTPADQPSPSGPPSESTDPAGQTQGPVDVGEIRRPVANRTITVYPGTEVTVDPDEGRYDFAFTQRTIDTLNTAQLALAPAGLNRPPRYGECAALPETAWSTTIRIQDVKFDARFCFRSSMGRLGFISVQDVRWQGIENKLLSNATIHWETWPK